MWVRDAQRPGDKRNGLGYTTEFSTGMLMIWAAQDGHSTPRDHGQCSAVTSFHLLRLLTLHLPHPLLELHVPLLTLELMIHLQEVRVSMIMKTKSAICSVSAADKPQAGRMGTVVHRQTCSTVAGRERTQGDNSKLLLMMPSARQTLGSQPAEL
jgi:hypothetical protein